MPSGRAAIHIGESRHQSDAMSCRTWRPEGAQIDAAPTASRSNTQVIGEEQRIQARIDRRTVTLAAALILGVMVYVLRIVDPRSPTAWSYQTLTLCLLVAAVAGRALVGFAGRHPARADLPWPTPLTYLSVVCLACVPFLSVLRIGFLSDDFGLALLAKQAEGPLEAAQLRGFLAFYRPVAMLLWWGGDQLWQGAPIGYHIASLLLHSVNSLLVYAVGHRLIGSRYAGFVAGLLFAVHPLHIEPATWPAASPDLLCTAFCLLSMLFLDSCLAAASRRRRVAFLSVALFAFLLALLSKEIALALPGVVILWLALEPRKDYRRQILPVGGAYALVLCAYVAWRCLMIGGLGGYETTLSFWNTVFPSAPLLMAADFLFPVHRTLFIESLPGWLWWLALILFAAFALWCMRGLNRVPAGRLWLWLGFLFLMAVPTWIFRWEPSPALEWSRFAYMPTIGLAWMFGDVCAGRGISWRRSGAVVLVVLLAATALTIWYLLPWQRASRIAQRAVSAGVAKLAELRTDQGFPVLFVRELPEAVHGAPIFANCYPQALNLAAGQPVPVRVISARRGSGGIHPDVMAVYELAPNEYLLAWDAQSLAFSVIRRGEGPRRTPTGDDHL